MFVKNTIILALATLLSARAIASAPRIEEGKSPLGIAGMSADELNSLLEELSPLPIHTFRRWREGNRYHYVITVDARNLPHNPGELIAVSFYLDVNANREEVISALAGAMRRIRWQATPIDELYPLPGTAIEPPLP